MFEEIVGQDLAKRMLETRVRNNRLPSALLFYGPDGVGKRTLALSLARVLNCAEVEFGCCRECPSCRAVRDLTHPNLRMIFPVRRASGLQGFPEAELYDEQGTISIEMVRMLRREASLKPYQRGKRIFIVLDAHRMKQEAQNAFLKLLEEPPDDTIIILSTARPDALSPTILSRCQRVMFRRLSPREIEELLADRMGADRHRAHLVASLSEGSLGRAGRMLEDYAEDHRKKIFRFVLESSPDDDLDIIDLAQELVNEDLVFSTLELVQSIYRDMLALKMGAGETLINTDYEELLKSKVGSVTWREIRCIVEEVEEAGSHLARNVNPRLVLFNLLTGVRDRGLIRT